MLDKVLSAKLREYGPENVIERDNVLQELIQHYVLASLSRAGLFAEAIFHGGTCLRIVNGMNRFSEDLDFLLKRPDPGFRWQGYLEAVRKDCAQEDIALEVQDKAESSSAVRKAFLKTDSIEKLLTLDLPFERHHARKLRIKLEIDTNPPAGSVFTTSYITFPVTAPLTTQTLESSFALKLHALLCRSYVKGRDWYDFVWYVGRKVSPELALLQHAIEQHGPWAGKPMSVTWLWLIENLRTVIERIDWAVARQDVQRFLPLREQEGLKLWDVSFFLHHLSKLEGLAP
ncbi:MAG: nucleotidyl transferase AbiEii/AbiGii toxin family protein [Verrucomicrobiota bacterium]|jgi:predicted nucleotidyltransferase component of viral defense system|nr:nucleotidyl transferase AbiEii/AbiGii toxin family protein [Verrucomicrobiota bacterium]